MTAKSPRKTATPKAPRKKASTKVIQNNADEAIPDNSEYQAVSDKVVEVRTPTSSTRFHTPNEKVELEREKLGIARQERRVQGIRVVLPNPRGMR